MMIYMLSEHVPSSDSDEDELGGTDTTSEVAPHAFDAQSNSDKVMITNMDDDQRLVRHHMRQGCRCSFRCYSQFTDDEVFHIFKCKELERSQRNFVLLGKLQVLDKGADNSVSHSHKTSSRQQQLTYQYAYDHRNVCKSAICFLHCIGEKILKNNLSSILKITVSFLVNMGTRVAFLQILSSLTLSRILWNLSQTTPQCLVYHSQQQEEDMRIHCTCISPSK